MSINQHEGLNCLIGFCDLILNINYCFHFVSIYVLYLVQCMYLYSIINIVLCSFINKNMIIFFIQLFSCLLVFFIFLINIHHIICILKVWLKNKFIANSFLVSMENWLNNWMMKNYATNYNSLFHRIKDLIEMSILLCHIDMFNNVCNLVD